MLKIYYTVKCYWNLFRDLSFHLCSLKTLLFVMYLNFISCKKFSIVSNNHRRSHKCDFSVFDRKFPFWSYLVRFNQKNQNCQFKLKFGTWTNSNMQNSMVMFILFVLDWKCHFWTSLVQNIKIGSLS